MNTKIILSSSAILMGLSGILLTFLPEETGSYFLWGNPIVLQILGALYFGFAMINWMSKGNLIGGIYNRPLAVGNLSHFVVATLALIKIPDKTIVLYVITAIYSVYAIAFGLILFTHPVKESKTK